MPTYKLLSPSQVEHLLYVTNMFLEVQVCQLKSSLHKDVLSEH
jgi:hypothetical protein